MAAPRRFDLGYDNADQLTTAPLKNASTNALIKQYTYGYDSASNRTSETVSTTTTTSTPNNVNEITSQSGGVNRTLTYDLNGSITSDGSTRTFEWDGANRLIAINYPGIGGRTEFTYNGTGHRVKTVEYQQNTPVWTSQFQPPDANYTFYSAGLTLPAGTYTFELRGLDLNNTVLLDKLMQNGALMGNGGFETPVQATGGYVNRPGGSSWMFTGESGVANRYAVDNPAPPEGTQIGFIQNMGSIWQVLTFATSSNTLSATAAQWVSGNTSVQRVRANIYAGSSPWRRCSSLSGSGNVSRKSATGTMC